ncbi:MAG: tetratricopeptide repeat protein [Deltaproteobacteria bacterium]|nr:tetratricopeptide repeat protein [Deltaproteobacteria bacterium]
MEDFPNDAVCRTGLAEILKDNGKQEEAEAVYREAMEDFPNDPVCRTGLAEILKDNGKQEEAEAVYRKTIKDFPNDPVCRTGLAEILKDNGKKEEAEAIYREAIKNFPNDEVCKAGLATLLFRQDKLEEAEKIYNQLLEKNSPNFENYQKALNNILRLKEIKDDAERKENINSILNSANKGKNNTYSQTFYINKLQKNELIDDIEIGIGRINSYRGLSLLEQKEHKKIEYAKKAEDSLKEIKQDYPDNIFVIKEEAWHNSNLQSKEAEEFFEDKAEEYDNDLSINIAELRYKHLTDNNGNEEAWKPLYSSFPNQKAAIALEQLMQQQNGYYNEETSVKSLNIIQKKIKKASENSFAPNQKLNKWFCETVQNVLFANIDNINTVDPKTTLQNLSPPQKARLLRASEQYISADR